MAANSILDRAGGKPKAAQQPHVPTLDEEIRRMTPEERYLMVKKTLEDAHKRYAYLIEDKAEGDDGDANRSRTSRSAKLRACSVAG